MVAMFLLSYLFSRAKHIEAQAKQEEVVKGLKEELEKK